MSDQLPLSLQWIVGGGFWQTLLICLFICPVLPQVLGLVFCSYWAPWHPSRQFYAYIPGNPCLALFIACTASALDGSDFHIPVWLNVAAPIGAFVIYIVLNILDFGAYRNDQLKSANKVYHNALYFWYGYLAVACFGGLMASDTAWWLKIIISIPGLVWLSCLVADNMTSKERLENRFLRAHADNLPIWKTGWRLRRFNPATGRYEVPKGPRRGRLANMRMPYQPS
jgi:hypothetical protein